VAVYRLDSGQLIAEEDGEARDIYLLGDVAVVDDVLVATDTTTRTVHFIAIDSIAGLSLAGAVPVTSSVRR
jgi:hypothetical protein